MKSRLVAAVLVLALVTVGAALPSLQEVLARLHRYQTHHQTCHQTCHQTPENFHEI